MKASIVIILLILTAANATINIISPNQETYYQGEEIKFIGNVFSDECYGEISFYVDGKKIAEGTTTQKGYFSFETITNSSLTMKAEELNLGQHVFKVSSECYGEAETTFQTTNNLKVNYEIVPVKAMTGDIIRISAYGYKKGEKVKASITINNNTFESPLSTFFQQKGEYTVKINSIDEYGNSGQAIATITIYDALTVNASTDKKTYFPGDEVKVFVTAYDVFGNQRTGKVIINWFGENKTPDLLKIPSNAKGNYTIKLWFFNGSNKGETQLSFNVMSFPIIKKIIIKDKKLKVVSSDQTGEPYNEQLELNIFDSYGNLLMEKPIDPNKEITFNDQLLPDQYSVIIKAYGKTIYNKTYFKNQTKDNPLAKTGLVIAKQRTTLAAGIIIIILTAIALWINKKQEK